MNFSHSCKLTILTRVNHARRAFGFSIDRFIHWHEFAATPVASSYSIDIQRAGQPRVSLHVI
jgi:hypothetical protein